MQGNPDWLRRLESATDYKSMQDIFSEMAAQAEAQAGAENPELAHCIDEAVRRLEQERARDEAELQQVQAQYQEFQKDNKGVVGWFKRHIPFTETRKQEVGHRDEVADQHAEILADNLVIARAQMLKERFLGPNDRKLGLRPGDWQAELASHQGLPRLANFASTLKRVSAEAERSRAFLAELKRDVEAFGGAHFKSKEDRERRDSDLASARRELASLEHEVEEESSLQRNGLEQACTLASSELHTTHSAFRDDGQRLEQTRSLLSRLAETRTAHNALGTSVGEIGALAQKIASFPAELQKLRDELGRAEAQRSTANMHAARSVAVFDERRTHFEQAQRIASEKQQVLASAKQFYDAYQAERKATQTTPQPVEADPNSPTWQRFQEAKASADAAQAALQGATQPYQAAKKEADEAQAAVAACDKQIETLRARQIELDRQGPQLRMDVSSCADRVRNACSVAANAFGAYLALLSGASGASTGALGVSAAPSALPPYRPGELAGAQYGWLGPHGLERGLADALADVERDPARHAQAVAVLQRLGQWHDAQQQALERETAAIGARRQSVWKQRCRELLGDELANLACGNRIP